MKEFPHVDHNGKFVVTHKTGSGATLDYEGKIIDESDSWIILEVQRRDQQSAWQMTFPWHSVVRITWYSADPSTPAGSTK